MRLELTEHTKPLEQYLFTLWKTAGNCAYCVVLKGILRGLQLRS